MVFRWVVFLAGNTAPHLSNRDKNQCWLHCAKSDHSASFHSAPIYFTNIKNFVVFLNGITLSLWRVCKLFICHIIIPNINRRVNAQNGHEEMNEYHHKELKASFFCWFFVSGIEFISFESSGSKNDNCQTWDRWYKYSV